MARISFQDGVFFLTSGISVLIGLLPVTHSTSSSRCLPPAGSPWPLSLSTGHLIFQVSPSGWLGFLPANLFSYAYTSHIGTTFWDRNLIRCATVKALQWTDPSRLRSGRHSGAHCQRSCGMGDTIVSIFGTFHSRQGTFRRETRVDFED